MTDSDRNIKFRAPNDEERFNFYVGGTGNDSNLQMYQADGSTIGAQINSATGGTSFISGPFKFLDGTTDWQFYTAGSDHFYLRDTTNAKDVIDVANSEIRFNADIRIPSGYEIHSH